MNRRDFLHPRRLARTAGQVLSVLDELQTLAQDAEPAAESTLLRFARQAMAATFEIIIPFGTPQAIEAADEALDEIDRLESQLTVFRDNSEVSHLNRHAFQGPIPVEAALFNLLTLAARLHRDTEGAFDIAVGALTKTWGFYKRAGRLPSEEERAEVQQRIGMQHVILDPGQRTVRYLRQGLEINLGSIGKGFALDRAAAILSGQWEIRHALLHGGKSSVLALGSAPGMKNGWAVELRHPWQRERTLGTVRLRDRALATSGATFQHLDYNGRKLGHILDPRSGWPAETVAGASVVAPTAAEADALSTAFFILGVDKAREYCAAHPGVAAVLLPQGDDAVPVTMGFGPGEINL
jgi:thiamine biosynthesis lipoprotein